MVHECLKHWYDMLIHIKVFDFVKGICIEEVGGVGVSY